MTDIYFWRYTVEYYDDFYEKNIITEGLIPGTNAKNVTDTLCDIYGRDEIVKMLIEYIDGPENVFVFKEYDNEGNILEQSSLPC